MRYAEFNKVELNNIMFICFLLIFRYMLTYRPG